MLSNGFIVVEGIKFPYPNIDSGLQTQVTMVDGGRNLSGVFIGRRVGRDQSKIELEWYSMEAQLWASLLQIFEKQFVARVEYYDMVAGKVIMRKMYVSDRSARPGRCDPLTGAWLYAKDCKLSLVDTGE